MLIPNPIASAAVRPDHPMLVVGGEPLSWGEAAGRVARLAGGLAAEGVGPGSVVALPATATVDTVLALHAIGWAGAAAAPLAVVDDAPSAGATHTTASGGALPRVSLREGEALPERPWPLDEARLVVHTSGSTGTPRPVTLTTGQLLLSAFASATRLGLDPADRWLACLPLHHVGGLQVLMRGAWYGTTVLLESRFDAARVAALLDGGEATVVSLVPQMLARVLDVRTAVPGHLGDRGDPARGGADRLDSGVGAARPGPERPGPERPGPDRPGPDRPFPPRLRAILLGGGPCPPPLLERCRAMAAPVALTWGMTEAASQVATAFPGAMGSVGGPPPSLPPLPFARVSAEGGRLCVAGPLVGGLPLVTTDRGAVDAAGAVTVEGRLDDAIVSGGEKTLPARVEAVLRAHPAVADVAVVAAPSPRWGEVPVAVVVSCAPVTDEELRAACRDHLRPHEVPAAFTRVAALPRTELGKLRRDALRALIAEEPDLAEGGEEARGGGDRFEGPRVDDRVDEPRGGAQHAVLADERVGEGQRPLAALDELHAHADVIAQADGPLEVGLGVDERRRPLAGLEGGLEAAEGGGPHLLVRHVAVLEDAPEEHDPGPVHLEEPGGHLDLPRHEHDLSERSDVAR